MRQKPNEVKSQGESGLARLGARGMMATKRSRLRRLTLETLEERALMATAPISVVTNNAPVSSNRDNNINDSNPYIAVSPTDPLKLVTVYTDRNANNGTFIRAAAKASSNGGLTWTTLNLPPILIDPTTTTSPAPYSETDGMGVGFDRNNQFYVGILEHNGGNNSGAVVLEKFDFTGSTPSAPTQTIVYQWNQTITTPIDLSRQPSILNFSLAVDNNLATFTDPSSGATQTDPTTGSVYIAWTANTPPPQNPPNPYNPFTIEMVASADGVTFPASGPNGPGTRLSGGNFGNQRYTAPQLAVSQGRAGGTGGQVTVIWDDFGSFATANPPQDLIESRSVTFNGTTLTPGVTGTVAFTTVRGAVNAPYPLTTPASPIGIGPGAQIAVDNTLGSYSANQGNLYVTYVDRSRATGNPADNTDIYLATSTNGGVSWSTRAKINDDAGVVDGYSGASFNTGRAQFEPSIGVDPATGTIALSWLDVRDDANRTRYATYLTTSIDGGQTFAKNTFANAPNSVIDAITGKTLVVGPMTDAGTVESSLSFGSHQGLAISNGVIHPVWSGTTAFNVNGTGRALGDGYNKQLLGIQTAQATYVYGPRIISSTMGPVASQSVDGRTFNNTFTATDHTQQIDGFTVTFDRPVNISSFTAADVTVLFRNTVTPVSSPGTPIALDPVNAIQPLRLAFDGTVASSFFVKFAQPQSAVGTYSYSVGPNITDKMWSPSQNVVISSGPSTRYNAVTPQVPQSIPDHNSSTGVDGVINSTINVTGQPVGAVLANITVTLDITHTFDGDLRIILISPDNRSVVLSSGEGGSGDNYTGTTFDSASSNAIAQGLPPFTGTFAPDGSLTVFNGGSINGIWTLQIRDQLGSDIGTLNSWSINVTPGSVVPLGTITGRLMDQNANGKNDTTGTTDVFSVPTPLGSTPFQAPYDTTTLPIIVPGPHLVSTFGTFLDSANVSRRTTGSDNLALNGTVSSIDVTFDRNMDPTSFTTSQILRMMGPTGIINGPFTVTPDPQPGENPSFPRTFKITFPTQQFSGTYTLVLGAGIRSSRGDLVDTNLNAGVSLLFQTPTAATTNVNYSPDVPLNSTNGAITQSKPTTSTITVNDGFLIQKVQVGLNITYPHDPDLTATLTFTPADTSIAPITITLFSNVGNVGPIATQRDFINTSFSDDLTNAPIQNGGPPFTGRFNPQTPLGVLNGLAARGTFTLTITESATGAPMNGLLTSFSLTLTKSSDVGNSTGLGEPVADQSEVSFRIFTMDPTNPLSSNTWTAVGGASNNSGGNSGRIGGIAVDPSDPSGNTVYVAGASGGIWKTSNFLTTSGNGPTYIPLTDAAATNGINIGSIAVFGRNNDPKQSIVVVSTGEGDATSGGVGFLISFNGGSTWTLLDSFKNANPDGSQIPSAQRGHEFVGLTSYKVIIDPRATPTGDIIIYAAMAGSNAGGNRGGIYRSIDTGRTWVLMRAGFATDVAFDPNSGRVDAFSNPTGNIRTLYGAFLGDGVYISPNQGQLWTLMAGGVGDPLIQNFNSTTGLFVPIPVSAPADTPNGAKGRLVIVHPALTGNPVQDLLYQNWLYVAASAPDGRFNGLFMTKDNGQNWVKVRIANASPKNASGLTPNLAPTNDITQLDYDIFGGQGNYDIGLTIDPNNPQIVYLGGSRNFGPSTMVRVDVSRLADAHSLFVDPTRNGGGVLESTTDPISIFDVQNIFATSLDPDPLTKPYSNLIRDPRSPFIQNGTIRTFDAGTLANTGSGARYTPFDSFLGGQTDIHRMLAIKDPVSGRTRLIIGLDQGVFSGVDDGNGNVVSSIGTQPIVNGSRNGNLQITQLYNGAAQPSSLAAQIAGALFYGMAQDNGFPQSDPNVLNNGNINWTGSTGDGTGVATDATGTGTSYFFKWPCCGGGTDFFRVRPSTGSLEVGRTNGLIQTTAGTPPPLGGPSDPQWPSVAGFVFGVNPVNPNAIVLGSAAGRLFGTQDQGLNWFVLAEPGTFDSTIIPALAFGAPDPLGLGSLDNYILAGTAGGHIYATFTGGGSVGGGNAWINISNGLSGGSVERIVTDPNRGSHAAYATTSVGVFYNADTSAANTTWVNITGNLFSQKFNPFGDPNLVQNQLASLGGPIIQSGLAADWRYVVPFNPANPNGPTHPLLYVAGMGGVFRSTDNGATWSVFPPMYQSPGNVSLNLTTTPGGNLPVAHVTDLSLSLGNVDTTTGRPNVATGPNILLATTYGRGSFAIRLAPVVFNDAINKPTLTVNAQNQPIISGLSAQSAFGNEVALTIIDVTDPANPIFLGGYNPAEGAPAGSPSFNLPANETDAFGRFSVQGTYPTPPPNNPYLYQGVRNLQIFATDASGTKGNIVTFQITNNPPAPPAPILLSNHVVSGGTNITDVSNPTFNVVVPGNTTIPATITLVRINSQNNSQTVATTQITGTGSISDPGPVPQGTYTYVVQYQVTVGSLVVTSPLSPPATVKIVPTITAALLPADDSGVANDNKTRVTRPRVFGVAPAPLANPSDLTLNLVELAFNGTPTPPTNLGTIADPNNGNYVIQFRDPLPDGVYSIIVQAVDTLGNTLSSRPVSITIKTTPPATSPTLNILPADDSGILNDGRTTFRGPLRPQLIGMTDPGATVNILDAAGNILAMTTASTFTLNGRPPGFFSTRLSANLSNGTISLFAVATDIEGNSTPVPTTPSLNLTLYTVQGDYNGDGKADLAVYRYDPSVVTSGTWFIRNSGSTPTSVQRGWPGHDIPVPGDYTGAGQTLTAVFRPETDQWFIGTPGRSTVVQLGTVGQDIPVPATYDLSGRTDVATYNPSTQTWNVLLNLSDPSNPSNKMTARFGFDSNDKPVPGDYTGVGFAELAIYRPGSGQWYVRVPGATQPLLVTGSAVIGGQPGDIPVPGDYDGINRTEPAIYRPSTGQFIVFNQATFQTEVKPLVFPPGFASQLGDVPVPQDYDGDGKIDLAIFRPNVAFYFINNSSNGQLVFTQQGFVGHDVPPQAPLSYLVSTITGGNGPGVPALAKAAVSTIAPAFLVAGSTSATVSAASTTMAPAIQPAAVAAAPSGTATGKASLLPTVVATPTPRLAATKATSNSQKTKAIQQPKSKVVISSKTTLNQAKAKVNATAAKHVKTPHDLALAALGKSHKGRFLI